MDKTFKFAGYENNLENGEVVFRYQLQLPGESIDFSEKLTFPHANLSDAPQELLEKLLDNLSLVLGISYWKSYCPENIDLGDVKLTSGQAEFWNSLYVNGLGEFFYKNKIDFKKFNLFKPNIDSVVPVSFERRARSLLSVGGGKDSIVSGELLKENKKEFTAYSLGSYPVQDNVIDLLGVDKIYIVRVVDPKLLEINNRSDSYNGHIPISAIYRFVGILVAALFDYKYLVMSNERSSNYGNVEYLGKQINHQWSKSYEYEKMFQNYVHDFITPDIIPFSLLRPLNEIKIVEVFSKYPKYFPVFSSCNKNFKIKKEMSSLWCGTCPKCLFVFVSLAAFLSKSEVISIFGQNLFENESLIDKYKELLGVKDFKPFDCVGTPEEVKLAFLLVFKKNEYNEDAIMKVFVNLFEKDFQEIEDLKSLLSVSSEYSIPDEFVSIVNSI